jgi:peptidoglycan-N-acetylglucosamine deacetylase
VIGNHTWSHPNLTKIPLSEVKDQIERTGNEIYRIANVRPVLFRPPYGALNADVIREIILLRDEIIPKIGGVIKSVIISSVKPENGRSAILS